MKNNEFAKGIVIGILFATAVAIWMLPNKKEEVEPEIVVTSVEAEEEQLDEEVIVIYEEPEIENIEVEGNKMSAPYKFIALDDDLQIYMEELCSDMEINFFLAASIMNSESKFNPDAVGDGGLSVGLFQIRNCWWDYFLDLGVDVKTPRGNILGGLMIIQDLMKRYPDDVAAVVQCYKCGQYRGQELMNEGIYLNCIEPIVNEAMDWQTRKEP